MMQGGEHDGSDRGDASRLRSSFLVPDVEQRTEFERTCSGGQHRAQLAQRRAADVGNDVDERTEFRRQLA